MTHPRDTIGSDSGKNALMCFYRLATAQLERSATQAESTSPEPVMHHMIRASIDRQTAEIHDAIAWLFCVQEDLLALQRSEYKRAFDEEMAQQQYVSPPPPTFD